MAVYPDSHVFHGALERISCTLPAVPRHDHAPDIQSLPAEAVDQPHDLAVVGDAQILPVFAVLNVGSVDGNDNFRIISEGTEHFQLAVG